MNKPDKTLPMKSGTSSLLRPKFSPGLLLEDEDLNAGVTYTQDLSRLMFRSLFGCGVICGLRVSTKIVCRKWEITVSKGLALDCLGNPIEIPADVTVEYDPGCDDFVLPLWVAICYTEKCCRPKDVTCSQSDDSTPQPTRMRAGYQIKLYASLPLCACHCATDDDTAKPTVIPGCPDANDGNPQTVTAPTATVAARGAVADPDPDACACYQAHYLGDCECGCCSCVIVAKIVSAPSDQNPPPDTSMVRRIRPMLNGNCACRTEKKRKRQAVRAANGETQAAPVQTAPPGATAGTPAAGAGTAPEPTTP